MKTEKQVQPQEFAAQIAGLTNQDFDGHTDFHRLSPLERLRWLDAAIDFIEATRSSAPCVNDRPLDANANSSSQLQADSS